MIRRTFNKFCRLHFRKKAALTDEEKHSVLLYVVRHRGPVHKSLVTQLLNRAWLSCMGYLHEDADFIMTAEHAVERRKK